MVAAGAPFLLSRWLSKLSGFKMPRRQYDCWVVTPYVPYSVGEVEIAKAQELVLYRGIRSSSKCKANLSAMMLGGRPDVLVDALLQSKALRVSLGCPPACVLGTVGYEAVRRRKDAALANSCPVGTPLTDRS